MNEPPNKKLKQTDIHQFFSQGESDKGKADAKPESLEKKRVVVSDGSQESIRPIVIIDSGEESSAPSEEADNSQHISESDDSEEGLISQYSSNNNSTKQPLSNLPLSNSSKDSQPGPSDLHRLTSSPVNPRTSNLPQGTLMAEQRSAASTVSYSVDTVPMSPEAQSILLRDIAALPTYDAPREVLVESANHTVFINTPTVAGDVPTAAGTNYVDRWDEYHVRMPCSSKNLYPLNGTEEEGGSCLRDRWSIIEKTLTQPMNSTYDIEEAVLGYNKRYSKVWKFTNLHQTFSDLMTSAERDRFFSNTLPCIVQLTISLPSLIKKGIPLLKSGSTQSLTFSQQQVASLVANSFFCTWPRRNAKHRSSEFREYPSINMNEMFAEARNNRNLAIKHKIKCIITYFTSIADHMPTGCITYTRSHFDPISASVWANSTKPLSDACFTADQLIEDAEGLVQADFANMRLGGGVLRTGCVQEEIQFVVHPELLASRLFTERLTDDEVFLFKGVERYSYYTGYADNFRFSAPYSDTLARDSIGRRYRHIVAMDATRFNQPITQYQQNSVLREVNKAFGAFAADFAHPKIGVSTGNWGCGAFRGNHKFKAVIQLMAASQSSRALFYSVFGDKQLRNDLQSFHAFLQNKLVTVGSLWKMIDDYEQKIVGSAARESHLSMNILQFIRDTVLK